MFLVILYSTERKFNVDNIHAVAKEKRKKQRRIKNMVYAGFLLFIKGGS